MGTAIRSKYGNNCNEGATWWTKVIDRIGLLKLTMIMCDIQAQTKMTYYSRLALCNVGLLARLDYFLSLTATLFVNSVLGS